VRDKVLSCGTLRGVFLVRSKNFFAFFYNSAHFLTFFSTFFVFFGVDFRGYFSVFLLTGLLLMVNVGLTSLF
jgi:hypothetical protein